MRYKIFVCLLLSQSLLFAQHVKFGPGYFSSGNDLYTTPPSMATDFMGATTFYFTGASVAADEAICLEYMAIVLRNDSYSEQDAGFCTGPYAKDFNWHLCDPNKRGKVGLFENNEPFTNGINIKAFGLDMPVRYRLITPNVNNDVDNWHGAACQQGCNEGGGGGGGGPVTCTGKTPSWDSYTITFRGYISQTNECTGSRKYEFDSVAATSVCPALIPLSVSSGGDGNTTVVYANTNGSNSVTMTLTSP